VSDLHYLSATDALAMFRSKELSPVELLEAVIARAATSTTTAMKGRWLAPRPIARCWRT
jgi:Asp-tRNA(Asn)/Glu-tRNA(Gln) amidotransferase A subunit family amidase